MQKSILVGPFLGEFGWELFAWQAHWRWHSREGTYSKIFVQCRPGREALYEDYAVFGLPPAATADGHGVKRLKVFPANKEAVTYFPDQPIQPGFNKQVFAKYGTPSPRSPDILIHARARAHRSAENWPAKRFVKLTKRLRAAGYTVGFVGAAEEAFDPEPGSEYSLLGVDLRELFDVLAGARCIVGSSSGPLHLASLCGCPQVVFSAARNHRRYRKDWNPFDTTVVFPPGKWQPTVEEAYSSTMSLLDTLGPGVQK